jgi:uncharacterized membrane protein YkvI
MPDSKGNKMIKYVIALILLSQFGAAAIILALYGQIGWVSAALITTGCVVLFRETTKIADRRYQAGEI